MISPEVVTDLVNVREVGQAVRVHHGEAVAREGGAWGTHSKPVHMDQRYRGKGKVGCVVVVGYETSSGTKRSPRTCE